MTLRTHLLISTLFALSLASAQGQLTLDPISGIVGSEVWATITGAAPGAAIDVVWMSVDAEWNVDDGRSFTRFPTSTNSSRRD